MATFNRTFEIDRLTEEVLKENRWFSDLLRHWRPAGEAAGTDAGKGDAPLVQPCATEGQLQHLRVAFSGDRHMNFYCGGQRIAHVNFGRDGLQAKIHAKYVYGGEATGKDYVTLTSEGFQNPNNGKLLPYNGLHELISNANGHIDPEKRCVDLVVAHNPNVIDLEMGLPAYSKDPGKNRAPRVDLVVIEPCSGRWRVVFWEVKRVGDPRARRKSDVTPEVVRQLKAYTDWFDDEGRRKSVTDAYQRTCHMLVGLHMVARSVNPDIQKLGLGIQAVAADGAPPLLIDPKPRLLIICDKKNESFEENEHLDKLCKPQYNLQVKMVETLKDLAL
jgi:hypothetical protein